jgi:hypothetical protein
MLRSTLGWVREKVDVKIASSEKEKPRRLIRECFHPSKQDGIVLFKT